jgi:Tol biopolymer transport system component
LIYSDVKGQWQIAADGKPDLIIEYPDAVLSPNRQMAIVPAYHHCIVPPCYYYNGDHHYRVVDLNSRHEDVLGDQLWGIQWSPDSQYVYYTLEDDSNHMSDIWVMDVTTHARRNLSRTPRRHEATLFVWPGQPDYLFFYSWPVEVIADGEGWLGYPTVMKTDGTEYQVISSDLGTGLLSLSPDGRTIAYSDWEQAWYYRRGESAQLFPWQDFGLTGLKNVRFNFPSWSPDGQKIAWSLSGEDRTGHVDSVGVFDLQTGAARFLKDWDYLEWSPGQRWITGLRVGSKPENKYGVWVADAKVENAHLLAEVFNSIDGKCPWVWSPDENWLAFNCVNAVDAALNNGIWLAELETGKLLKTNLPDDAEIRGWMNPQP